MKKNLLAFKPKEEKITIGDEAFIVREPTARQMEEIFDVPEGDRMRSILTVAKHCLRDGDGTPTFGDFSIEQMMEMDLSVSVLSHVTTIAMAMAAPEKKEVSGVTED